jgi:hypothetical protein
MSAEIVEMIGPRSHTMVSQRRILSLRASPRCSAVTKAGRWLSGYGGMKMVSSSWLIPWEARGMSGPVCDSLLWRHERLYVMDNHRLALWCWWQHLAESDRWTYVHIDRHFDAFWLPSNPWKRDATAEHRTDLGAFRNAQTKDGNAQFNLYRWDTVTSALWCLHGETIDRVVFATANEGDDPRIPNATYVRPWSLLGQLADLASTKDKSAPPCIVDVDIDYFTWQHRNGMCGQLLSDEFVGEVGRLLKAGLTTGRFGVVTVALSPSTTGSWRLAEHLLSLLLESFPEYEAFRAQEPQSSDACDWPVVDR